MSLKVNKHRAPFPHWVIDGAIDARDEFREVWACLLNRPTHWKWYHNELERKCLIDFAGTVGEKCERLCNQRDWLHDIEEWTGLEVDGFKRDQKGYGGSIHVMRPGDYLACHLDRELIPNSRRPMELRLAIVVFLMREWEEDWGGHLDFYDKEARNVVSAITPAPNRIVVWQPSNIAYHGVREVSRNCPVVRATANCFYYAPARPGCTRRRALFVPNREHEHPTLVVNKPYPRNV